jgi:hypothetical protein
MEVPFTTYAECNELVDEWMSNLMSKKYCRTPQIRTQARARLHFSIETTSSGGALCFGCTVPYEYLENMYSN